MIHAYNILQKLTVATCLLWQYRFAKEFELLARTRKVQEAAGRKPNCWIWVLVLVLNTAPGLGM